jgi:SAM-dependent methyltransferase
LEIMGREVLELGPGRSLGLSLIFLAAGARRVIAVDRYRHLFWDEHDCDHLRRVLARLESENWTHADRATRAVRAIQPGRVEFDPDYLVYRQADGAAMPLPADAVDLSYSNAVLEHVHRPATVVRELARVTRPGGDSIHEIDFRDHFDPVDRLRLLTFPEWEWQVRTRLRPGYTNRWRQTDFRDAFAAAGLYHHAGSVTNSVPADVAEARRAHMTRRFRARTSADLCTLSYWGWWKRGECGAHAQG